MASAEPKSTESCEELRERINARLTAGGVTLDSGEEDKLFYLWRLYEQSEMDLKSAQDSEQKLKETQAAEMKEVESYVEHIRHLSEDREVVIQELETENDQLKSDLEQARSELTGQVQKEASEMLTEQGLGEIATATPSEQVAYLLVERARLLDQLDGATASASASASASLVGQSAADGERSHDRQDVTGGRESQELKEILEQERKEFEEALNEERERSSSQREVVRKEHEEEVSALMEENAKLEEDLQQAHRKSIQLEKQIERLKQEQNEEQDILEEEREEMEKERDVALKEKKALAERVALLEREKEEMEAERDSWKDSSRESCSTPVHARPSSPLRSPHDVALRKVIEDKTKLEGEMIQLRSQIRALRDQKEAMEEQVKKANEGSEKLQVTIQQLQMKNKNLRQEVEELETQLDEAETAAEESKKQEEQTTLRYRAQEGETSLLREEVKRIAALQDLVDVLSGEKSELTSTLDGVRREMHKILAEKEDLNLQTQQLTASEQDLSGQVTQLKAELSALEKERDDLSVERDDLMTSQTTQDDTIAALKSQLSATKKAESGLKEDCERMEREVGDLKHRLQEAETQADGLKGTAQQLATQELIVSHLKEEKAGLQSQVADLQTQLQWVRQTEQSLLDSQQTSQKAHTDTEKRLIHEIDELRATLQKRDEELETVKLAYSEEQSARTSLSNQLSAAESQLQEQSNNDRTSHDKSEQTIKDLENKLAEETQNNAELETRIRDLQTRLRDAQSRLEDESHDKTDLELTQHDLESQLESETRLKAELQTKTQDLEKRLREANQRMEETTHLAESHEEEKRKRIELECLVKEVRQRQEEELADLGAKLQEEREKREELERKTWQGSIQEEHTTALYGKPQQQEQQEENQRRLKLDSDDNRKHEENITLLRSELQQEQQLRGELEEEVAVLRSAVQQEKQNCSELEFKVQELEEALDDAKVDADNLQHSLKVKVSSLEDRCQQLQDDLFAAQDELMALQEKHEQAVLEAEDARCEMLKQQAQAMEQASQVAIGADLESSLAAANKQLQDSLNELNLANTRIVQMEEQCAQHTTHLNKHRDEIKSLTTQKNTDLARIAELENQHATTSARLSESQAEVKNLASQRDTDGSRIGDLEKQCVSVSKQLQQLQAENKALAFEKDLDSARIVELQSSEKAMKRDLQESVAALTEARSQLSDKTHMLDGVSMEMEALNRELQYLRESSSKEVASRSRVDESVKVMEVEVRQLEQDKRELSRKLTDAVDAHERMSQMLEKEKARHSGPHHQSARYVEQLEIDLNAANKQIRCLRDDLQHNQTSVFKLEADSSAQSAKYETMVVHLEDELKDLRQQQRRESDNMGDKVASATSQFRHAHAELVEKEKTITELRRELLRSQSGVEKLQAQLDSEQHARSDLESRNVTLEQEMNKVWGQVRTLMERNNHLETAKNAAEEDLDQKNAMLRQLESSSSSRESTLQSSVRELRNRAECAEKHEESTSSSVSDLQADLSASVTKATTLEQQLRQAEGQLVELPEKCQQLASVRNQLEGEKLQRTLLEQTVGELKHQVSLLRQREEEVTGDNKELQFNLHDLQSRLRQVKVSQDHRHNDSITVSSSASLQNKEMSVSTHKSLLDQISTLQQEVKSLQYELLTSGQRHDLDLQKYEERKHRTKNKLIKAREFYSEERKRYAEHMRELEDDLRLTRAALNKELEWKDKMDVNYQHLLQEKRGLVSQLSEQGESLRDKSRALSMLEVRASYLEDENRHLQRRLDALTAQKQTLDRLVKDFQHNRDREVTGQTSGQDGAPTTLTLTGGSSVATVATSGLGNSTTMTTTDVTWEQDQAEDGRLVFHPGTTFHHVGAASSGSVPLSTSSSSSLPHRHHHHSGQDHHRCYPDHFYPGVQPLTGPHDLGFYPLDREGGAVELYHHHHDNKLRESEGEGEGSGDEFEA
ncbi:uncharacterized protein LOC143301792 [Babylonia areolata]|uniref:uncharacterized protein LOC143301792 n=1 Tax=Babylonia areolata TaxID=304850 RepID=UPI003FD55E76